MYIYVYIYIKIYAHIYLYMYQDNMEIKQEILLLLNAARKTLGMAALKGWKNGK
jgi:hypothetical protein